MKLVRLFYDAVCPNSWVSFKVLRQHVPESSIDLIPVNDFRIGLIHNNNIFFKRRKVYQYNLWKKTEKIEVPTECAAQMVRRIDEVGKELASPSHVDHLPSDWQQIYSRYLTQSTVIAAYLLTSIKDRRPELLHEAAKNIGTRMWEQQVPVHSGFHMWTVCKQIGIGFDETEDIVSKLTVLRNKQLLREASEQLVDFKISVCRKLDRESEVWTEYTGIPVRWEVQWKQSAPSQMINGNCAAMGSREPSNEVR